MLSIAETIRNQREKLKLRQNELANRVGVTSSHVNRIESGTAKASPAFIVKVAQTLNLDLLSLYVSSLKERDVPDEILHDLREIVVLRPLFQPGMPLNRITGMIDGLDDEQVNALITVLEIFVTLLKKSDPGTKYE